MRWEQEWVERDRPPAPPAPARPIIVRAPDETPREVAWRLLESHLTDFQIRDLKTNLGFNIRGSAGYLYRICRLTEHAYRLARGDSFIGSIDSYTLWNNVIDQNLSARGSWPCTRFPMPEGDTLLAQKLYIESDEYGFRRNSCEYSIPSNRYSTPHSYAGMI